MAERGAFTFSADNGEQIKEVPFVYSPNLMITIAELVDKHDRWYTISIYVSNITGSILTRCSGLTWHRGAIPSNELWLKLSGDKGRGSFKLTLQLVNTHHPNSLKNTHVVSIFKAGDSVANLHTALDIYAEHVKEAQEMEIQYVTSFRIQFLQI